MATGQAIMTTGRRVVIRKNQVRWRMLAVMMAIMMSTTIARFAIGPIGTMVLEDLQISRAQLGFMTSASVIGAVTLSFGAGVVIDRVGAYRMMLVSLTIMGLSLVLFVIPVNYALATFLLFLTGVGFSIAPPVTNAGIVSWFPQRQRGTAIGLKQAGSPIGIAIGGMTLPALALWLGWQNALVSVGLLLLLNALAVRLFYRNGPLGNREKRRLAAAAGGVPGGSGRASDATSNAAEANAATSQAVPAVESAATTAPAAAPAERPPSPLSLFSDIGFVWIALMGCSLSLIRGTLVPFLVPYLEEYFALPKIEAGFYLSMMNVAGIATLPLMGWVSDRLFGGRRKPALLLLAFGSALVTILMGLTPATAGRTVILALVFLSGIGSLGWTGSYMTIGVEQARPSLAGAASGLTITAMMLGNLIGPPLFGSIVDATGYSQALVTYGMLVLAASTLFAIFFKPRVHGA